MTDGTYELVLRGGHVIDPAHGRDGVADVALAGGRIAAVGAGLEAGAGRIIDMHASCFDGHRRSRLSLNPHVNTFSSGVPPWSARP